MNSAWWKNLSEPRKEHIENVVQIALKYNQIFRLRIDENKIIKAGYLHDIGKSLKSSERKKFIKKHKIKLDRYEKKNSSLIHAPISAFIAKHYFGIKCKSILKSIKFHTISSENMSRLCKLIYFSDFMTPDRKLNLHQQIIDNSDKGLDNLLIIILNEKIKYLLSANAIIHPNILKFRNRLLDSLNKRPL